MSVMACTSKSVRFGKIEIEEFAVVKVKLSWGAQQPTSGVDEEEPVDLDGDRVEREKQRALSKRSHALLALGRAAELRAQVIPYLAQDTSVNLPEVVGRSSVPRRARRSSAPPKSSKSRSQRRAPQARDRSMAVDNHNVGLLPLAHAQQTPSPGQSEPLTPITPCLDSYSCDAVADSVQIEADTVLASQVLKSSYTPDVCRTAGCSHLTAWTPDDAKTSTLKEESWSDNELQASGAVRRHFETLTPKKPSEVCADATPKEQLLLSPTPPSVANVRPRPPARRRKFLLESTPHALAGSVQACESGTDVQHGTSASSSSQFLMHDDESFFAEEEYAAYFGMDDAEKPTTTCASLPPRSSSI